MVLVLFSVTFFTETNQKRIRESLSFIRAISATSIAVSLPAAPIGSHRTQCVGASFIPSPTHGYGHILLKGPLFYLIYFLEVSYQILFDTDDIGYIMSCFFTHPVSIISLISACNCFIAKILSTLS
jgi:hypothetical protein